MSGVKGTYCHNESQPGSSAASQAPKQNFGQGRIPDILECLANLSNDEVFTPPAVASAMLDLLPEHVWSDPNLKWLDIGCKTGVFLREAAKRLMVGLEEAIPSERDRIDHILGEMLYGIATSHLTGLVARRTLYSATEADGDGSSARFIADFGVDGNIRFQPAEHIYGSGAASCTVCGAPKSIDRPGMDNYAYELIHIDNPQELFTDKKGKPVKFDVVIGNPPYQMDGGRGGTAASSIYQLFTRKAIDLNPSYVSLIIPARWLKQPNSEMRDIREKLLKSGNTTHMKVWDRAKDVFPDVNFSGGVMHFLWCRDPEDGNRMCSVEVVPPCGEPEGCVLVDPTEFDMLITDPVAANIARKAQIALDTGEVKRFDSVVMADTPFGIPSNAHEKKTEYGFRKKAPTDKAEAQNYLAIHFRDRKLGRQRAYVLRSSTKGKGASAVDSWKLAFPKTGPQDNLVLGVPFVVPPGEIVSQTFLVAEATSEQEARSLEDLYKSKLFRFLVGLFKVTQDAPKTVYQLAAVHDLSDGFDPVSYYKALNLSQEEIEHVESTIKEMP